MNTNPIDIEFVLTRGVENIYPTKEALKAALLSGKKLRIYAGFDPSAKSLHIGNAIVLEKLSQLQKLGHQIIFLIGSFTGMIGDPTDKTAARVQLTRSEVIKNSRLFKLQASHYLKFTGSNPALVKYNHAWHDKINFKDLISLASHFTVQQMIERDMFQKRLTEQKPIYLHEFFYPLAQAYDSVALDVDMEIGGNDQTFNMLCGRNLVKELNHKEKFVLTLKLLADPSGKKMGKTEGNIISLDASPDDMYGQVMAWPDTILLNAFELCTNIPDNELAQIKKQLLDGLNPKEAKSRLAFLITELNYDNKKAAAAQDRFEKVFSQKDLKGEMTFVEIKTHSNLIDIVLTAKPELSKSAARRLIEQNAVSINQVSCKDWDKIPTYQAGDILKIGKHEFWKIK
ncbi:MAG TPA: tyrosine--tRNA ligase [Candidatus Paceibacterota bacterium]|nr:tyrosine--tRNA ligase [Candidatus Paceibacterota bacterium]